MINLRKLVAAAITIAALTTGLTLHAQPKLAIGPNQPVGEGKGIYPARVVWTHAPWHGDMGNGQRSVA